MPAQQQRIQPLDQHGLEGEDAAAAEHQQQG